jgi:4-amino-4-deoxy-L-arabinose transferase-like glycosyltransferase
MTPFNLQGRSTLYAVAGLLAIFVYFFGLDSHHIPKNGDENPYANVTRMTAATGHWLPLQSEVEGLRNSKPPLLFWQGIVSTQHAREWTLWNLRYPAVIYTLLTAAMVFLLGWKYSHELSRASLGALAYLAFYSTYRYGRPFLTNAPETFWLSVPFFVLLYWPESAWSSRWLPLLLGMAVGVGMLYKSFAMIVPVGLALTWWYLHRRNYRLSEFLRADAWKLIVVAAVSLAMFSCWFLFDPDPMAVWHDFVMRENAGKFVPTGASYLETLLWGGSSVWTMILGGPINAGLLALPVAALMGAALRDRKQLSQAEQLLWIWFLAVIVAFTLPSQRSARYLLPAMPALATLCGLGWNRLGRVWFLVTLAVCALGVMFLAYESLLLQRALFTSDLYSIGYWLVLLIACGFCLSAMLIPALSRPATPVAALLVFLSMAAFLQPFDGPHGNFSAEAQRNVANREVWVPSDWTASYEDYRFLLPTARIRSYEATREQIPDELARRYPLFVVRVPLGTRPCDGCRVLGERLDLRGRLSSADLKQILRGRIFQTAVLTDQLLESPVAGRP